MIVTIFRSRLNPGVQEEYGPMAKHMSELARTIPGYVSHKGFAAEDGERVTIVEFESEEALQEWRHHPEHAKAKRRGIQSFFSDYKFQICTVIRDRVWTFAAKSQAVVDLPVEAHDGPPRHSATARTATSWGPGGTSQTTNPAG
jgi:heme-degrading monooxygenase HmoA